MHPSRGERTVRGGEERDVRPRVAYLRPWQTLSDYEMGYVMLLGEEFDLDVITVGEPALGGISYPVRKCVWPDTVTLGGRERSLLNAFYSRVLKRRYHIPGLEPLLRKAEIVQGGEAASEHSYQAARLKERYGFRLLLSASENLPLLESRSPRERDRILFTLSKVDHAFCISRLAADRLVEAGFDESAVSLLGHGIDCERFSLSGRKATSGLLRVGYCGRFTPEKGLPVLIEAARSLPVKLVFQGAGPLEQDLKRAAPQAQFLPPRPYRENHLFYKTIDLFVLPSIEYPGLTEQFGFVLIEAMASGLPIVASRVGGIPEVVDDAAVLVPPNDPETLRAEIARLANDRAERERLGRKGRERALRLFRREFVAERMRKVYRKLLSERK
ncbi:MAG: glycosyltransferase [Candidatus Hydrogenedentota bacterium]|nr:MAG: glycosyltransferase [Candidatus Hydrogenedentota bacterium]